MGVSGGSEWWGALFVLEVVREFVIFQLLDEVNLMKGVWKGGGVGVWMRGCVPNGGCL